ncbi:hypothetical protein PO909_010461 [Leuciscus waleckii]
MAGRARKQLVWDVKRDLITLPADELFRIAKGIGPVPGHHTSELDLEDSEYIQPCEFKIHGGQIDDHLSDITYNNVCRQIDSGLKENFSNADIVRGVLRIIKPGFFKDMLMNKDDMTVAELKVYHGLSHRCKDIRSELKPLLADSNVTDDAILRHVMKVTSDENERLRRLGPPTRTKQSTASSAQVHSEPGSDVGGRTEAAVKKSQNDPIKQLTARIDALTNMVDTLQHSMAAQNPSGSVLYELQLSYGLFGKASEESITIIHPAGDESMHKFL